MSPSRSYYNQQQNHPPQVKQPRRLKQRSYPSDQYLLSFAARERRLKDLEMDGDWIHAVSPFVVRSVNPTSRLTDSCQHLRGQLVLIVVRSLRTVQNDGRIGSHVSMRIGDNHRSWLSSWRQRLLEQPKFIGTTFDS